MIQEVQRMKNTKKIKKILASFFSTEENEKDYESLQKQDRNVHRYYFTHPDTVHFGDM